MNCYLGFGSNFDWTHIQIYTTYIVHTVACTLYMWSHTKRSCIDMYDVRHVSHTRFSLVGIKKSNFKYEGSHLTHHTSVSNLFDVNAAVTHEKIQYINQNLIRTTHDWWVGLIPLHIRCITFICTHRRNTLSIQAHTSDVLLRIEEMFFGSMLIFFSSLAQVPSTIASFSGEFLSKANASPTCSQCLYFQRLFNVYFVLDLLVWIFLGKNAN